MKAPRAFTLVEIVIVVLILSIVATAAVPALSEAFVDLKLRSVARTLMADLNYARNLAITEGVSYGLTFTGQGYSVIRFTDTADLDSASNEVIQHPMTRRAWTVNLASDRIGFQANFAGDTVFYYDATGSPTSAGRIVITQGGLSVSVVVDASTGRITVQAGG